MCSIDESASILSVQLDPILAHDLSCFAGAVYYTCKENDLMEFIHANVHDPTQEKKSLNCIFKYW